MKNREKSISTKIIWLVVLLLILSNSIICLVSITRSRMSIRESIQQRMLDIANCASGGVDGDVLKRLTAQDQGTPDYQTILDQLAVFRDNVELEYVYGIRDEGEGRFSFTVDPAIEDPAAFGDEVVTTEALITASEGTPAVDEVPYQDEWGWFYSAYSPVFDSAGGIAGIIAVDFSVDWFESQLTSQIRSTMIVYMVVLLLILIAAAIVTFFSVRTITDPLKKITQMARQYEQGNYEDEIFIDSNDEVGKLSRTLRNMSATIRERTEQERNAAGAVQKSSHIVIVDDERMVLKTVGHTLTKAGMHVTQIHAGKELLSWIRDGNSADLILLDILMPEMDGFETLAALRALEAEERRREEIPVIFLTSDEDKESESRGFSMGAVDYIRKPIGDDVLVHRIENVLSKQHQIQMLSEENLTDPLTGMLNKMSTSRLLEELCAVEPGILMVIDLDNFKMVNDIYGHDNGDKILTAFARILKSSFRSQDILGRIGGDEFIAFLKRAEKESLVADATRQLNDKIRREAVSILGQEMKLPLGVSVGAAISIGNTEYESLFKRADRELLTVKQEGKHGYRIWHEENGTPAEAKQPEINSMQKIKMILDERTVNSHALWLGQEDFGKIYRYMLRYFSRYRAKAYRVLILLTSPENEDLTRAGEMLGEILKKNLRSSDLMMQCDKASFLVLLPTVTERDISRVLDRIREKWENQAAGDMVSIRFEQEPVILPDAGQDGKNKGE